MNKVEVNDSAPSGVNFKPGDIFVSPEEDLYILAEYNKRFVAISLNDGYYWSDMEDNVESAVDGLDFWGSNVIIKLER
jgi:hypothetical protein